MPTHVLILLEVSDEYADPNHELGMTSDGYSELCARGTSGVGLLADGPIRVDADTIGLAAEQVH